MGEHAAPRLACAILDDYQDAALRHARWARLEDRIRVTVHREHHANDEALAQAIGDAEIVVAMRERTPFRAATFGRLPKLRLLVTTGRANAAIDLAAASAHGVTVCATGTCTTGTAELTWGLILSHARSLAQESANLRAGGPWQLHVGRDLAGRTLGILGLGVIGTQVARVGRAFGMRVIAWSAHLTEAACGTAGATHAGTLDHLLEASDIVTVHLGLGPGTRGLLGRAQLQRMKRGALLVNTARSGIVDETAIVEAVEQGWIGGAAVDVFDQEPLPRDHPFRSLASVLATPHIGYVTADTYDRYYGDAVEDIQAWLDGHPVRVLRAAT